MSEYDKGVEAGLEKACELVCEMCKDKLPWYADGILDWRHQVTKDGRSWGAVCKATAIRQYIRGVR